MARPVARPVRVMIVEDSATVRALLSHIISADPRLEVAAAFATAEDALAAIPTINPDVISMDIRLPGIDGLEATRRIMAAHPTPIVVISASLDRSALGSTMDALRSGALAVVEKPEGVGSNDYRQVASAICTQLAIMSEVAVVRRRISPRAAVAEPAVAARPRVAPRMLCVAASTGGPPALARLFSALPADLPVPVLLVQHMGGAFMPGFATWLDSVVPQRVSIARHAETPEPGRIYVAPGDAHLLLSARGTLAVDPSAPVGGQRPSANVLIGSAARALEGAATAVVLTGMGEDGGDGVRALVAAGGAAIAEHEHTAVVYGMPQAAVRAGALALPIDLIAPHLRRVLAREPAA